MEIKDAVTVLNSLAQPVRLRVFRLLVKAGEEGMCAGDLSRELDIPKNTLSFHLKELSHADLVDAEREGRSIIYRLRTERMRALMQFLVEDCCEGRPDLCLPEGCSESACVEVECAS